MKIHKTPLMGTIVFFSLFILLLPLSVAHLEGGDDKIVGAYLIDLGYEPAVPNVTDRVNFVISLLDTTSREAIRPDHVWFRIASTEEVVFAGTFYPGETDTVVFTYRFPYPEEYTLTLRFFDEDKKLVETSFLMTIGGPDSNRGFLITSIIVFLFLCLVLFKQVVNDYLEGFSSN